jgi:hypothetical protein
MERVETLCNLLAEKIQNKASINELLSTVKMMESELLHLKSITPPTTAEATNASIHFSKQIAPEIEATSNAQAEAEPEKIIEVLHVDEAEIEAELEEIKKNAEVRNTLSYQNRPAVSFEGFEDIPTLANRQPIFDTNTTKDAIKELNDILPTNNAASLNDILGKPVISKGDVIKDLSAKELNDVLANNSTVNDVDYQNKPKEVPTLATIENNGKELNEILPTNNATSFNDLHSKPVNEVSDIFEDAPIKDLKKAIGVNERFLYLNELFRGDEAMYERSIKTINAFTIYPEAEFWIRRELKLKLGWDDKYNTVKQFDQLVRRRFS